jgi:hypothetical protein
VFAVDAIPGGQLFSPLQSGLHAKNILKPHLAEHARLKFYGNSSPHGSPEIPG